MWSHRGVFDNALADCQLLHQLLNCIRFYKMERFRNFDNRLEV